MRVLIACEFSGIVRDAFAKLGHDAWSCDLLPTERLGNHIQDDVLKHLDEDWDLMIAHPPCTHLSVSGARWFTEGRKPMKLRGEALKFVQKIMDAPIYRKCVENPLSVISSHIRPADQVIHPYKFGHPERKTTCLWLTHLPPLRPTRDVKAIMQTKPLKEQHRIFWMGSGKGHERSIFFTGIADAMAEQWGCLSPVRKTECVDV